MHLSDFPRTEDILSASIFTFQAHARALHTTEGGGRVVANDNNHRRVGSFFGVTLLCTAEI